MKSVYLQSKLILKSVSTCYIERLVIILKNIWNPSVALDVHAISNPHFPLTESVHKNLIKLYLNDVGMLTTQLYDRNIKPIIDDIKSVNLGAVYESVVAQELRSHGYKLFYYDNRNKGEVDFIIDDYNNTSVLPIEVKSGRDYSIHSALNNLISTDEYNVKSAFVLSNEREVKRKDKILYLPIYYIMFINNLEGETSDIF